MNLDEIPDIELSAPVADGRIEKSIDMGFITLINDETSQPFVDFAEECKLTVYGVASIAALKRGATVISNKAVGRMLCAISKSKELTADDRKHINIKSGYLPDELGFEANSLGAIHLRRCMHFFKPEMIDPIFERAHKWLESGGRLFITTMSFFHYSGERYLDGILERKKAGVEWPGEIHAFG